MSRWLSGVLVVAAGVFLASGCSGRHSPSGFRLPPGDPDAGKKAFVELECHTCHTVAGVDFPKPTVETPVALGGRVVLPPTDGDLTTDIILPSSHFARGYPASAVREGADSRMPDYTTRMTVRQLADLVAFMQTRYSVVSSAH